MAEIVAVVGDTHTTSTVGLCNPNQFQLDDGGSYRGSKGQRWMWRCWLDYWKYATDLKINYNALFYTVFLGDMVEHDIKHRSKQIVSRNVADIVGAAVETLAPAMEVTDLAFFVRGTGAHVGKSAEYEEMLARDCDIAVKTETGNSSWWKLLAEFEGVLCEFYHHASMGRKPWTLPNSLNSLAVELMIAYAGQKVPNLAVRGHNHRPADTFDNYPVRIISIPSWQLATEYTHRIGSVQPVVVGGIFFICDGGEYQVIKRYYEPERTRPWKNNTRKRTG